jgi:signal transduction histidine kinase
LALVQAQATHLRHIVEALLFLARADADADLAGLESIDLRSWLAKHVEGWCNGSRGCDIQLETSASVIVRVHPVLLGQLIDNLLDNAFKYSEAGTPIRVAAQQEAGGATVTVQDGGPGISADDLPHIFEAFYRSAEARRQGKAGVGLGLAMARRIATALGGTLSADSEIGRGTMFTLWLPVGNGA